MRKKKVTEIKKKVTDTFFIKVSVTFFTFFLARVILFLVVAAGVLVSLQYTTNHYKADRQILILNRTLPDFHKLLNIEKHSDQRFSKNNLKEYFDYFHLVTEAMPDNSDGLLMLGYLEQVTGHNPQAGVLFKAAHRLDPQFFFIEFNLALFLFEQGDYEQSAQLLQRALNTPPQDTLKRMMSSTVYRQIFASTDNSLDIIGSLRQSYHDAYILLLRSLQHSGHLNPSLEQQLRGENANTEVHARIL